MIWLVCLLLVLILGSNLYYCLAIYGAFNFFKNPNTVGKFCPEVTVIKPVCGVEWQLENSLLSFCEQKYPNKYQVIFCLQNSQDPALDILERIKQKYAKVDIEIVTNSSTIGNNLKISNLANALEFIKYPFVVIADSDIQVEPNYLQEIIQPLAEEKVGLVTCLYTSLTKGFLAAFEALEIATQFHPRVLTARQVEGIDYGFGATIVTRKTLLEKIGGFQAIADYLADDYQLGNLVSNLGYQVVISTHVVAHRLAHVTWEHFIQRQNRWAKCIRVERFWGYLGLIFTQGTVFSLLLLILTQGAPAAQIILLVTWANRMLMAFLIGVVLLRDTIAQKYLFLVPVRDIFSFLFWLYNFLGNTVNWRNHQFQLTKEGKLIKL